MAETIGERIADEFMRWQPDEDDYDTVRDRLQRLIDAAIAAAREECVVDIIANLMIREWDKLPVGITKEVRAIIATAKDRADTFCAMGIEAREQLAEAHAEHERLLAYAREVRGSRDVHSVYEVLDWQREQLAAKEAEAAAIREALLLVQPVFEQGYQVAMQTKSVDLAVKCNGLAAVVNTALASTAGEAMLARLQAAEKERDTYRAKEPQP